MTTSVYDSLESLENRFLEIQNIIDEAQNCEDLKPDLYKILCRAAQILLIAHFEGYIRELVKSVLDDINSFQSFKNTKKPIQRTFCELYMNTNADGFNYNEKTRSKLIEVFSDLNAKFIPDPFVTDNKNPKSEVLERVAKKFGIDDIFSLYNDSVLENVFNNDSLETDNLYLTLKRHTENFSKSWPFQVNLDTFNIGNGKKNIKNNTQWKTFFDEILQARHNIAHGSILENTWDHRMIHSQMKKLKIFIYSYIMILCNYV